MTGLKQAHLHLAAQPQGSLPHEARSSIARTIASTTAGNALEFFDFTAYGFFVIVLGRIFFPSADPVAGILWAFAGFGVGYVARPLGAIVIGSYADRHGRKRATVLTLYLMALGCALIGFAPTHAQVGPAAAGVIVIARMIQGFSAGGEVGASTTLLLEHASVRNRGFVISWQLASQGLGVLAGAIVAWLLHTVLTTEQLDLWGWRVPFWIGMLIAPVGAYMRRHLRETLDMTPEAQQRRLKQSSLRTLLLSHKRTLLLAFTAGMGGVVSFSIVTFYMPNYAVRELGISSSMALVAAMLSGLTPFVLSPMVGWLCDQVGRKRLVLCGRAGLCLLIVPCFLWLTNEPSPFVLGCVVVMLTATMTVASVPGMTIVPEMFPKAVRASGMSIVAGLGLSIFGGFSPLIVTWLVNWSDLRMMPAWYLLVMQVLSTIALLWIKDRTGQELDQESNTISNTHSVQRGHQ